MLKSRTVVLGLVVAAAGCVFTVTVAGGPPAAAAAAPAAAPMPRAIPAGVAAAAAPPPPAPAGGVRRVRVPARFQKAGLTKDRTPKTLESFVAILDADVLVQMATAPAVEG